MIASRSVWSSAVFIGDDPLGSDWTVPKGDPQVLMNTRAIKIAPDAIHTIADPFVFNADGSNDLYLFAEEQRRRRPGRIKVWNITPGLTPRDLGELNFDNGHVSFPFVFEDKGSIFIVPETSSVAWGNGEGEVALYRFVDFPTRVEKLSTLLTGPYTDSFIVTADAHFYLFTSRQGKGLLYISEHVEGPYRSHPQSPISSDNRNARAAGAILPATLGRPFPVRPGQNCSVAYGGDLTLMKVIKMTPDEYAEETWVEQVVTGKYDWASTGSHHISQCRWNNQTVTAFDGKQNDYLVNRLLGVLLR